MFHVTGLFLTNQMRIFCYALQHFFMTFARDLKSLIRKHNLLLTYSLLQISHQILTIS